MPYGKIKEISEKFKVSHITIVNQFKSKQNDETIINVDLPNKYKICG
jgi:hypothetical protein